MEKEIKILSRYYNYVENGKITGKAIYVLDTLSEEDREIVLKNPDVQKTILSIKNIDLLRHIFKISPSFFQEKMFENENVKTILLSPRLSVSENKLIKEFNNTDVVFRHEELRKLENFLHNVKSDKIREQIVDDRYFQMIVSLCLEKQIETSFFEGLNVERLFENISKEKFFYMPKRSAGIVRKRNFLEIINKGTNKLLLTPDCEKILKDGKLRFLIYTKNNNKDKFGPMTIDKETFNYLSNTSVDAFLDSDELDKKLIEDLLVDKVKNIMSKEDFKVEDLLTRSIECKNTDYFHVLSSEYYCLIMASDYVKNNDKLKNEYIDFIFSKMGDFSEYPQEIIQEIKKSLFNRINSRLLTHKEFNNLIQNPSAFKTIFYLKFNKSLNNVFYLHNSISENQMLKLNVKHVNQIINLLSKENEDEISLMYQYAINMYLTFGLERSLRILRGEYGNLNKFFFDNLSKLNVKDVEFKKEGSKYIPIISEDFNHFMFNTEKENNFKTMLKEKDSSLNKYWCYLFNEFDGVKEKCHNNMTIKRVNIALEYYSPVKDIGKVALDNYKLIDENILEELCLGNKTSKKNEEIYKEALDIYEQMKRRQESSIPYVKGICENGYSYQMMRLNDPIALTLGYKGDCCIRVNDVAHNHLLHATLCRNGRILIIYNEKGKIAAFSPLKRNGEVLIANSIECASKIINEKAIQAFSDAVKDIVKTSNEEEEEPIGLVCIGKEAYAKPQGTIFPTNIDTPTIYEKGEELYKNTDCYHRKVDVVYKEPKVQYSNLKYGNPKASYKDPRLKPKEFERRYSLYDNSLEDVLKVINGVRYAKIKGDIDGEISFRELKWYDVYKGAYSEDWFAFIDSKGRVVSEYLDYDSRAKYECAEARKQLLELVDRQVNKR